LTLEPAAEALLLKTVRRVANADQDAAFAYAASILRQAHDPETAVFEVCKSIIHI
jgi:hypothetical protein